ncbi:cyclase family protein [Rhodococcus sp. NCIMB 12038]|uniref:cyclase family protein n=1 Tax=Rhodococcus sp. NCIMB 12038 TaxID=933800 RepID=UPI000B3CBEE9|nr:cyclase family protein [Rhodococcus sp. NCIMB 12038]OUS83984.1 hypothetical protein CA951_40580 [Rhodococcus sp. NCIMB 12038]
MGPEGTGSTAWGRWGEEDERGALNLLTPERILASIGSISHGRVFPLGLPVRRDGVPFFERRGATQRLTLYNAQDADQWAESGAPAGAGANADLLISPMHNGTHIDALAHVFDDGKIYNGFASESFTVAGGASRCGIDKIGGIVGRAVLLDIPGTQGLRYLEPGTPVTAEMIVQAEKRQGSSIGVGDIVLLHTGWMRYFFEETAKGANVDLAVQPGLGPCGGDLLIDRDVAAVGADNLAVEVMSQQSPFIELHRKLLVRHGITFVEGLNLQEAISAEVTTGMLVIAPLMISGGSGSPVNPLLIV